MGRKPSNIIGIPFGRLTVIKYLGKDRSKKSIWECQCSCGNLVKILGCNLMSGRSLSCGCYRRDRSTTHGHSAGKSEKGRNVSRTYTSWHGMLQRCNTKNTPGWENYGGRGIAVCDKWKSFENFLVDIGECPGTNYSIDRFPSMDSNYEPENCRWATRSEQNRNRRNNRLITYMGETLCLTQWTEITGVSRTALLKRLDRGWSLDDAMLTPMGKKS